MFQSARRLAAVAVSLLLTACHQDAPRVASPATAAPVATLRAKVKVGMAAGAVRQVLGEPTRVDRHVISLTTDHRGRVIGWEYEAPDGVLLLDMQRSRVKEVSVLALASP